MFVIFSVVYYSRKADIHPRGKFDLLQHKIENAIRMRLAILSEARTRHVPEMPRRGIKITPVTIAPKKAPMWSAPFVAPADTAISLVC